MCAPSPLLIAATSSSMLRLSGALRLNQPKVDTRFACRSSFNSSSSRSAALDVDNDGPTGVSATLAEGAAVSDLDVTVQPVGTDADEVWIEGNVQTGANTFRWVPMLSMTSRKERIRPATASAE